MVDSITAGVVAARLRRAAHEAFDTIDVGASNSLPAAELPVMCRCLGHVSGGAAQAFEALRRRVSASGRAMGREEFVGFVAGEGAGSPVACFVRDFVAQAR